MKKSYKKMIERTKFIESDYVLSKLSVDTVRSYRRHVGCMDG